MQLDHVDARLLDQPSERPANFDLATAWKASTERYQEERPLYYATLRIEPRTAEWVAIWRTTTPVPEELHHPGQEDWKTLRIEFEHEAEAAFVALGLGTHADVVEPATLRQRVAAEIAAVIQRNQITDLPKFD